MGSELCPGCRTEKFIDVGEDWWREFDCGSTIALKGAAVIKVGEFMQSDACARIAELTEEVERLRAENGLLLHPDEVKAVLAEVLSSQPMAKVWAEAAINAMCGRVVAEPDAGERG